MRSGGKDTAAVSVLTVLFVVFFFPVLFQGKAFFFRDIIHFAFPMKQFIWQSFAAGGLPLWWPHILGGVPFLALMHPGVFYPLNLVFLAQDFQTAFNWFQATHHFILTFSVYALARYWRISVFGAMCSALTALFGGYFLSLSSVHNHFQSAVWLPLIFLLFQKYLMTGRSWPFAALVLVIATQTLGGSPENCILTVGTLFVYSITVVPGGVVNGWLKRSLALGCAIVLGLGLSALQLIPTYRVLSESTRSMGISFDAATRWSLGPEVFSSLFLPEKFAVFMDRPGEVIDFFLPSVYMGLIPIFLLFSGLVFLISRAGRFWVAAFWVGVFFAMGRNNPLYETFYNWVPVVKLFRYPEKFIFLPAFSLVFLSGYGLDALLQKAIQRKFPPKVFAALLAGMLAAMVLVWVWAPERDLLNMVLVLSLFGVAGMAFIMGKLKPILFQFLVFILLAVDLLVRNTMLAPMVDEKFFQVPPKLLAQVSQEKDLSRVYTGPLAGEELPPRTRFSKSMNLLLVHMAIKEHMFPNFGAAFGVAYPDGKTGLGLTDPELWRNVFKHSPEEKRFRILKRSNVRYWITEETGIAPSAEYPLGQRRVEEFTDVLPRAFLVNDFRKEKYPQTVNVYFQDSFDPTQQVLISEDVDFRKSDGFQGEVREITYGLNQVRIKTRQNADGFLVLLDSWFPGWTVQVDGRPGHILRGNHFYRTVKLGPGDHTLQFKFRPIGLTTGYWVTGMSLLILALVVCVPPLRTRCFHR